MARTQESPIESDFLEKYPATTAEQQAGIRAAYAAVVEDLINELRRTPLDPAFPEEQSLRAVAEAAIRYARELTRDRDSPIFGARYSKAQQRLSGELERWQLGCERRDAEWEAERKAAWEAQESAKKEERRRRRVAKKAKLAAGGSSTP